MAETVLMVVGGIVIGGILLYILVMVVFVTLIKMIFGGWL